MWIKTVFLALIVVSANCAVKYSFSKNNLLNRNQRIIKVHATPQFNHFHSHSHKHVITRPFVIQQIDATKDFIRPSHSHSNPSFFNGPSTNHIKHLSRPPPHVVHKIPSYGINFPYKNINSLRTNAFKAPFRVQASGAVRPPSIKQSAQITQSAKPTKVIPSPSVLPAPQIPNKEISSSTSLYSPTFAYSNFFSSSPIRHIISSDDNNGPIKEIPAPNLGPKPTGGANSGGAGFNSLKHIQSTAFSNTLKKPTVKINTVVRKPALDINTQIKDFNRHQFSEKPSIEIKDLDQSNSNDLSKLFKNAASLGTYNLGYEVKEPNNNIATNDQVLKSLGEKFYYAPDPDPSLPVHKVPPTNDPQSTPPNGQSINNLYFPQVPYGIPYFQGVPAEGPVATLTPQELYQLMQGYPTILSQPQLQSQAVVSFIGQPQANGVIVPDLNQNYYNHQNTKETSQENEVSQYLQRPDIHNLIHNSPENLSQQSTITSSISNPTENLEAYSHQSIYQGFNQPYEESENTNLENSEADDFTGPDSNNNYDFEPEASESKNSFTVIRQSNEGTQGSTKVKNLLLEDSSLNNINFQINDDEMISSEKIPKIFELKNAPEVPLYSTLPNQQAAEALAGLQAAGSIANNYINKIKAERENEDKEDQERKGKASNQIENGKLLFETDSRKTVINLNTTPSIIAESVDDEAISEDNTEFTLESQIQEDLDDEDFKDNLENIPFGERLRPK